MSTKRSVVGATNRKSLQEVENATPAPRRLPNTRWIATYQAKVMEAVKVKAAHRKQHAQPSDLAEGNLIEPYIPNENRWMIMSYEVDIKADANNRLNYIVRRLQAQAAHRGRQLFRRTETPRTDDDLEGRNMQPLQPISSGTTAPNEFIVAMSLLQNPSALPQREAFISTWMASTSAERRHDPSMIYKKRVRALEHARSRQSHVFQQGLEKFAASQERMSFEKDRRLLLEKGALQRAYKDALERKMAMTKTVIRRGLGEYNTLVLPQLKDKVTSIWGTFPNTVVEQLCDHGTIH